MQRFACSNCRQEIYFDNVVCGHCGLALGFEPARQTMLALVASPEQDLFETKGLSKRERLRYCANHANGVCNWLVPVGEGPSLCTACALNRTIPDLSIPANITAWGRLERAKRMLVYTMMRLGLPVGPDETPSPGLRFDFFAGATTGHADGLITIALEEANAVERERQRTALEERYRSLLGHMRHESGHYYWMLLVEKNEPLLGRFRQMFGDERADYATALTRHHNEGSPADWMATFVTAYASSHPWEDWAESWAHYLHIVDVLDTAFATGVYLADWAPLERLGHGFDAYRARGIGDLIDLWLPLTLSLNALNRSMGHQDFYPFVLSAPAIEKLGFVHEVVLAARGRPKLMPPLRRPAAASG